MVVGEVVGINIKNMSHTYKGFERSYLVRDIQNGCLSHT